MDSFTLEGNWYTPGNESDSVPGTMHFEPLEGITLDLYHPFPDYPIDPYSRETPEPIETVFGRTKFEGRVTLRDCQSAGWRRNLTKEDEDVVTPSYQAEYGFLGEHAKEGPQFTFVSVSLSFFKRWIFNTDIEDFEVSISDGTEFSIHYTGLPGDHPMNDERGSYLLIVSFEDPVDIDKCLSEYVWPFQQFLSFGLFSPIFIEKLSGKTTGRGSFERSATGFREIVGPLRMDRTTAVFSNPQRRLLPDRDNPLGYFTLAHIEDVATDVIQNWFESYLKHRPLFDLYFNTIFYDDQPYPSVTLLNLTRALESYHRESDKFENTYIDEADFKPYRRELNNTIKDSFPEDFQGHLRNGTFKFANRLALRRRLEDIIDRNDEILHEIFDEEIDSEELARKIKNTRNDLTHLSDEDITEFDRKAEGTLNRQIGLLIEVVIADEVGIPKDIITNMFA